MAWTKITNPKAGGAARVGPTSVRVTARAAMRSSRYIAIQIGGEIARKGSLTHPEHKCHLMVGSAEDAGKIAIAVDDSGGPFKVKRQKDGGYKLTVSAAAAAGKFSMAFPPFTREAKALAIGNGPAPIVFEATAEFLAYA